MRSTLSHEHNPIIPFFQVPVHAPVTESLSTLSIDKLQKLIQYAINEDPGGQLRKIFKLYGRFYTFYYTGSEKSGKPQTQQFTEANV